MENKPPWHTGKPSPSILEEIEVMMEDSGKVRRVLRIPELDYGNFFFTDCTHPAQNAYCWMGNVKAWRHL